jgi:hypothetical protein
MEYTRWHQHDFNVHGYRNQRAKYSIFCTARILLLVLGLGHIVAFYYSSSTFPGGDAARRGRERLARLLSRLACSGAELDALCRLRGAGAAAAGPPPQPGGLLDRSDGTTTPATEK